jgi:GLPGLI family protein
MKRELFQSKKFNAILYFKNKEILYKEITTEKISEAQPAMLSNGTITLTGNEDKVQMIVYKNYEQNKIYYTDNPIAELGRLGSFITDSIRLIYWEGSAEERIINGRRCTKYIAVDTFISPINNRKSISKWTAWVDLSVPFSEGPMNFNNLPGLVVQLGSDDDEQSYNTQLSFTLQEIGIGSKIDKVTLYPEELEKAARIYTKAEYDKKMKDLVERLRVMSEQDPQYKT